MTEHPSPSVPDPASVGAAGFRAAFEHAPIGMALLDARGRVLLGNPQLAAISGLALAALAGRDLAELAMPADAEVQRAAVDRVLRGETVSERLEVAYPRGSGTPAVVDVAIVRLSGDGGEEAAALVHLQDVSDRRRFEERLRHLAEHDALTGLFNRRRFEEELDREVLRARRRGSGGAVVILDLDHFKYINDSLGHAAGDQLIISTAEALRARLRATDVVARLGGDEFAVLLPDVDPLEASVVAWGLLEAVRTEVRAGSGVGGAVSASAGISCFDASGEQTGEALRVEADIAMYDAKESGRDGAVLYDRKTDGQTRMRSRLTWVDRIRTALEDGGLVLYEQPIVPLAHDGRPRRELLLRLRSADGELFAPGTFLPAAERFDLIKEIDRWVLREAIELLAERQRAGEDVRYEVNLSGRSIDDARMASKIAAELSRAGADGRGLCLEITETAAVMHLDGARRFAQELAELGCTIALDDFGAGFSSFYYLKHLTFDLLKIDGEFIRDLPSSRTNQLLVQSIVEIARGLGKRTVAEHVEDESTLALLRDYGVDYGQGFLLGRPQPVVVTS